MRQLLIVYSILLAVSCARSSNSTTIIPVIPLPTPQTITNEVCDWFCHPIHETITECENVFVLGGQEALMDGIPVENQTITLSNGCLVSIENIPVEHVPFQPEPSQWRSR